jgi:vitamin B12/bleomycin/antimicrobial peptide transport system ATP-binding/permease protein
MSEPKVAVSRETFQHLMRAIGLFLKSPVGGKAKWFLLCLAVLMLSLNGMNVLNSYVGRFFMSSIESRDTRGFMLYAWMYVGVFAVSTLMAAVFRFSEERLGLLWRDYLTRHAVGIYVDHRLYLQLEHSGALTNPDQRMTEDIRQLTATTLSFILMISNGTLTAISFSGVLWTISPKLFVMAVLYAAAGSMLTIRLGRPLIRLNYQQSDCEANFRSELIRLRSNADRIALAGNEGRVRDRILARVDDVVGNLKRIIRINLSLNCFTGGYNYMIQLIPTLVVAPLFMSKGVEFGVIGQAGMAFATLLGAFSLVITQFQAISSYTSVVARLDELVKAAQDAAARNQASRLNYTNSSDRVVCSELTIFAADDPAETLVRGLNISFAPGRRVLTGGPNQDACAALFSVLAGLHDAAEGKIRRPEASKMVFLPERPYLLPGTLREQLMSDGNHINEEEMARLIRELGLETVVKKHGGLEAVHEWQTVLSLEEQQRLSIARAVLAKPDFAFMVQLDSAFSDAEHARVLALLAARGITCISFGDYPPDPVRYDDSLCLNEDGSWTWTELSRNGRSM